MLSFLIKGQGHNSDNFKNASVRQLIFECHSLSYWRVTVWAYISSLNEIANSGLVQYTPHKIYKQNISKFVTIYTKSCELLWVDLLKSLFYIILSSNNTKHLTTFKNGRDQQVKFKKKTKKKTVKSS